MRAPSMLILIRLIVFALGFTVSPLGAAAQTGTCLTDWTAAGAIVKSEGLVTVDQLTKLAPSKLGGDIVRISLCEAKTGYVYKLVIKDAGGQIKNMVVDAKSPF
jgi:uncharacterized membrane protein YkoI